MPLDLHPDIALVGAVCAVLVLAMLWRIHVRQPYFRMSGVAYEPQLARIRGWLLFIGITLLADVVADIFIAYDALPFYETETWNEITRRFKREEPWPAVWGWWALCAGITEFGFAAYAGYAFVWRRRSFPLLFLVLLVMWLVGSYVEYGLAHAAGVPREELPFKQSFIVTALWAAYITNSKRVRATFLPPPEPTPDVPANASAVDQAAASFQSAQPR